MEAARKAKRARMAQRLANKAAAEQAAAAKKAAMPPSGGLASSRWATQLGSAEGGRTPAPAPAPASSAKSALDMAAVRERVPDVPERCLMMDLMMRIWADGMKSGHSPRVSRLPELAVTGDFEIPFPPWRDYHTLFEDSRENLAEILYEGMSLQGEQDDDGLLRIKMIIAPKCAQRLAGRQAFIQLWMDLVAWFWVLTDDGEGPEYDVPVAVFLHRRCYERMDVLDAEYGVWTEKMGDAEADAWT